MTVDKITTSGSQRNEGAVCTRCRRQPRSPHTYPLCDECDIAVDELIDAFKEPPVTVDKITTSGSQRMIWRYHQGAWSHITDPIDGLSSDGDYDEELRLAGFLRSDSWGELNEVVIYEKAPEDHWRIYVSVDAATWRTIEVTRLPDLLDVLAKLAPITTASMVNGLIESLQEAIWNAQEDGKKERLRRYPELRKRNQKR